MSLREIMLGKSGGKTGWQHLKDRWAQGKAREKFERVLGEATNPLGLQPGDLVDLGLTGEDSYEVELFCWYHTPGDSPDFARYSLRPLVGDADAVVLEAMPSGELGEHVFALFRHHDDVHLDDEVVEMLEADELTYALDRGEINHAKDFETEARLTVLGKDHACTELDLFCFAFYDPDNDTNYLTIDALDHPHNVAHVYVGSAIDESEVNAIGTVLANQ